jgi:hypothetical protein
LLTQPLPCDGYPKGISDFVVKQCRRQQLKLARKEILRKRIGLLSSFLVT